MKELTNQEIQEIINRHFYEIPCSEEAKKDREELIRLIGTIKLLKSKIEKLENE